MLNVLGQQVDTTAAELAKITLARRLDGSREVAARERARDAVDQRRLVEALAEVVDVAQQPA